MISRCARDLQRTLQRAQSAREISREICFAAARARAPHPQVSIALPAASFGPWETAVFAPEAEFIEKMKAIEGVSGVETQTMTFMAM